MKCYFILISKEQKKNLLHFTDWASAATALASHFYLGDDNSIYFQVLFLEKQYLQNQHQLLGNISL